MPKIVIERGIAGIGGSSAAGLPAISQKSCCVLEQLGTGVQWAHDEQQPIAALVRRLHASRTHQLASHQQPGSWARLGPYDESSRTQVEGRRSLLYELLSDGQVESIPRNPGVAV